MNASNPQFSEKFIGIALLALAGPFVWVLHFAVVYGVQHIACVTQVKHADFWVEISIIVITVAALLALVLLIAKPDMLERPDSGRIRQDTSVFLSGIMRLMALLSIFAVLWTGIALFFLPACGSVA